MTLRQRDSAEAVPIPHPAAQKHRLNQQPDKPEWYGDGELDYQPPREEWISEWVMRDRPYQIKSNIKHQRLK